MSDEIARHLFLNLHRDFQLLHGDGFGEKALIAFSSSPSEFRDYVFPTLGEVTPSRFKAWWQLQNLFKRYQFECDKYSPDELIDLTYNKYFSFQESRSLYSPCKTTSFMVLQEARKIAKSILSLPYKPELYRKNGKRATHGCTLKDAYFDNKLGSPVHFTCPTNLANDLQKEVDEDPLFKRVYNNLRKQSRRQSMPLLLGTDTLKLTLVPKSWKTLRPITPLSVFGLYWSYGIGGYVEECLRFHGLDIKRLQERHKYLAQKFSKTRTHVTADLSSASDSLRSDLLNRVLPRSLFVDLRKTFIRQLEVGEKRYYTESVLPMGNAATFPVETLVFYCLIRAIGNLMKVQGIYSVYGDDLIYPRKIHTYVISIFNDLGIGINGEKTFCQSHFRESCGGDYYHGIDVRPFLFPEDRMPTGRLKELQYLYKILNTLTRRWDPNEIPNCIKYLKSEILMRANCMYFVPSSYPDTSGWKVDYIPSSTWFEPHSVHYAYENGSAWIRFNHLGSTPPKNRSVVFEQIYYWDALRFRVQHEPLKASNQMNRTLARLFLRTCRCLEKSLQVKGKLLLESCHVEGKPRVSRGQVSTWS